MLGLCALTLPSTFIVKKIVKKISQEVFLKIVPRMIVITSI